MLIKHELLEYDETESAKPAFFHIDWTNRPAGGEEGFCSSWLYPVLFQLSLYSHVTFSMQEDGMLRRMRLPIVVEMKPPPSSHVRNLSALPAKKRKPVQR